jgi:hypothetical protein
MRALRLTSTSFAILPKQHPIAREITNEIPPEIKSFFGYFGRKTGCELRNAPKLGELPNQAQQAILVKNSRTGRGA